MKQFRLAVAVSLSALVGCSSGEIPEVAAAEIENMSLTTKDPEVKIAATDKARAQATVDAFMAEVEADEKEMARIEAEGVVGQEPSK